MQCTWVPELAFFVRLPGQPGSDWPLCMPLFDQGLEVTPDLSCCGHMRLLTFLHHSTGQWRQLIARWLDACFCIQDTLIVTHALVFGPAVEAHAGMSNLLCCATDVNSSAYPACYVREPVQAHYHNYASVQVFGQTCATCSVHESVCITGVQRFGNKGI